MAQVVDECFRDMKFSLSDPNVMGSNPVWPIFGRTVLRSAPKSDLNQKLSLQAVTNNDI